MATDDATTSPPGPGRWARSDDGTEQDDGTERDDGTEQDDGEQTGADVVRAVVVVLAALAQVVAAPLGSALPGAVPVPRLSDTYSTVVTPAGYAFAIWGVIFTLCLAWAVYQALPSQRGRSVHRRAGWPLAVAFAGNAAWQLVFPQDGTSLLVAQGLILVVVAASALALGRLQDPEPHGLARVLPAAAAALLLGWVTIATVVEVALTGVYLGLPAEGGLARGAGVVALFAAAAIVLDVTLRLRTSAGPFALAAAWGVLGVVQAEPPLSVRLAAWAALAVILAGLLVLLWRTRRPVRVLLG